MTDFRRVTADFFVAPQLSPVDIARAADAGVRMIVNNRPDREEPGQPSGAEIKAAAEAAGLAYRALPFTGPPPPGTVAETALLLEEAPGPVLAYCRSGRRSIMAWAMAQALAGARRPNDLIALAGEAGYDLEGTRGALEGLSPKT
ncbi:MAG: TIGR01244 family sulfur transferase [Hyphomonadaceae bacterium]